MFLRFICSGRIDKPLTAGLIDALPSIKDNATDLQTYAVKINEELPNEEATDTVIWGNEVDYIWWIINLAIPMPLPEELQTKLPHIKDEIRQLKICAVNSEEFPFHASYHICHHDSGNTISCELGEDI